MIAYIKFDDPKRGKTYFDFHCDSVFIDNSGYMIFTGVKEPEGKPNDWLSIEQVVLKNKLEDRFEYNKDEGTAGVQCSDIIHVQIEG